MLRLYHVLLGGILVAVLTPLGFIQAFSKLASNSKLQSPPTAQTSATNSQLAEGNIWKTILGKTDAPSGWNVAACEGNAPLLCVSSNGKILGTVEMEVYPLEKQPNFQKMLSESGISAGSKIDYQNPKYHTQVASALKQWVVDHYSTLAKDHQRKYGDKIAFSSQPAQEVKIGKLQGMSYGFAATEKQGEVHQEYRGYVTFDGKALYVITTAFDTDSKSGKFDRLESLRSFEPHLSTVLKEVKLPK